MQQTAQTNINHFLFCFLAIAILTLTLINLNFSFLPAKVLGISSQEETSNTNEASFWQNFMAENPTYLDGWLELSKIALNNQDPDTASSYLQKASEINPASEKIQQLKLKFSE